MFVVLVGAVTAAGEGLKPNPGTNARRDARSLDVINLLLCRSNPTGE